MTSAELLERLLELTPLPPADADVDALLAAANAMLEARGQLLAATPTTVAIDTARLAELAARDAAWRHAITTAQQAIGGHRVNAAKLRRYAP